MSDQPSAVLFKTRLHILMDKGRAAQQSFLDSLTEAQRSQIGESDHWAAKDIISHTTFWQDQAVKRAKTEPTDLPIGDDLDETQRNDLNFQATRTLPWVEIIARSEAAYRAESALIDSLAEDDLQAEAFFRRFIGDNYLHPVAHYVDFYLTNGDQTRASAASEQTVLDIAALGQPLATRIATYNLACFHARNGNRSRAIELLAEPLHNDRELYEWAKVDTDLDSLRAEPAFQAFYAG